MEPTGTILCSVCGQHAAENARFCRRCAAHSLFVEIGASGHAERLAAQLTAPAY